MLATTVVQPNVPGKRCWRLDLGREASEQPAAQQHVQVSADFFKARDFKRADGHKQCTLAMRILPVGDAVKQHAQLRITEG